MYGAEEKLKTDKNYTLTSSGVIGLVGIHNQIQGVSKKVDNFETTSQPRE